MELGGKRLRARTRNRPGERGKECAGGRKVVVDSRGESRRKLVGKEGEKEADDEVSLLKRAWEVLLL